ncbi:MAG: ArsR/SmtB family transcription factor [Pyrinomonadaceae bacterium]
MSSMLPDVAALEKLFLGLADKTRLRLLGLMAVGPVSVGYLVSETGESQPKISRHLAYLRNAGLVDTTRDGKWIYYGLADLADSSAESVFQCVVGELNGSNASTTRSQPRIAQQEPQTGAAPLGYDDRESADEDRSHSSDESREELPIFLL